MQKEVEEELRVSVKLVVLELADHLGVSKACRKFNVPRSSFYRWKQKYKKVDAPDRFGLANGPRCEAGGKSRGLANTPSTHRSRAAVVVAGARLGQIREWT